MSKFFTKLETRKWSKSLRAMRQSGELEGWVRPKLNLNDKEAAVTEQAADLGGLFVPPDNVVFWDSKAQFAVIATDGELGGILNDWEWEAE